MVKTVIHSWVFPIYVKWIKSSIPDFNMKLLKNEISISYLSVDVINQTAIWKEGSTKLACLYEKRMKKTL